jgi:hypothetical protein
MPAFNLFTNNSHFCHFGRHNYDKQIRYTLGTLFAYLISSERQKIIYYLMSNIKKIKIYEY